MAADEGDECLFHAGVGLAQVADGDARCLKRLDDGGLRTLAAAGLTLKMGVTY